MAKESKQDLEGHGDDVLVTVGVTCVIFLSRLVRKRLVGSELESN